jgi:hypothetical protein
LVKYNVLPVVVEREKHILKLMGPSEVIAAVGLKVTGLGGFAAPKV